MQHINTHTSLPGISNLWVCSLQHPRSECNTDQTHVWLSERQEKGRPTLQRKSQCIIENSSNHLVFLDTCPLRGQGYYIWQSHTNSWVQAPNTMMRLPVLLHCNLLKSRHLHRLLLLKHTKLIDATDILNYDSTSIKHNLHRQLLHFGFYISSL